MCSSDFKFVDEVVSIFLASDLTPTVHSQQTIHLLKKLVLIHLRKKICLNVSPKLPHFRILAFSFLAHSLMNRF